MAYCRTKATIEEAIQEGVIDIALEERDDRFADCDYIFLCAPVSTNISYLPFVKGIRKTGLYHHRRRKCKRRNPSGGGNPRHDAPVYRRPSDGRLRKDGYSSATDYLLENAYYMITPGPDVEIATVSAFVDLVQSLKAIPMVLTYEEHDYITAGVSHLPHIVAATLVNALASLDTPEEQMKTVAAGGFKDITRIASSSPEVWQQICLSNQKQLSNVLDSYIRLLVQAKYLVDNKKGHELYNMFESSREYRNSMEDSSYGPTKKEYVVYCDLLDEAGGIAAVTTILAINQISIKNIGITHNREFEEGALRIEFYEEQAGILARKVLKDHGYTIHIRN